jgi:hypothetical protein
VALLEFGEHPIAHRFLDAPDENEYTNPVRVWFSLELQFIYNFFEQLKIRTNKINLGTGLAKHE